MELKSPSNLNSSCVDNLNHYESIFAATLKSLLNYHLRFQLDSLTNHDYIDFFCMGNKEFDIAALKSVRECPSIKSFIERSTIFTFKNIFYKDDAYIDVLILDNMNENIRVSNGSVYICRDYFKKCSSSFNLHSLFRNILSCPNAQFIRFLSDDHVQAQLANYLNLENAIPDAVVDSLIDFSLVRYFRNKVFHNLSWCFFKEFEISVNPEWLNVLENTGMSKAIFARIFTNVSKAGTNSKLKPYKCTKGLTSDSAVYKHLMKSFNYGKNYFMAKELVA
jgi:hypothetical protein